MSSPDKGSLHVNRPLTNMSVGILQEAAVFAAYRAFPVVGTKAQGNSYYKYNLGDFTRDVMQERAPGAETVGIGYKVSVEDFFCKLWGVHHDVPDQNRANQDEPLDEDLDAANQVVQAAMIRMERQWGADYFVTGKWWRDVVGNATSDSEVLRKFWNDPTADPIGDIEMQRKAMLQRTTKKPNKITMGYEVWSILKNHPAVIDRVKPGQTGLSGKPSEVSKELFAMLAEVDEVIISEAVYNAAGVGVADDMRFILGKNALLSYSPPAPGRFKASCGYTFVWTGYTGMNSMGYRIKKFRMEANAADRIEIESAWSNKIVHNGLATFFSAIIQ